MEQQDPVLVRLAELANMQVEAAREVVAAEAHLERQKKRLLHIATELIPELMDSVGMESYTTTNGLAIKVENEVKAGISKDRAAAAFAWLRQHGHGKLIKNKYTIVPANDEVGQLVEETLSHMPDSDISNESAVHWKTLSSFVAKELEAGREVDMELLGVFQRRVAKVTHNA